MNEINNNSQSEYKPLDDELYSKLMADMQGIREAMQKADVSTPTFVDPNNGAKLAGYSVMSNDVNKLADRMRA